MEKIKTCPKGCMALLLERSDRPTLRNHLQCSICGYTEPSTEKKKQKDVLIRQDKNSIKSAR